MHIAAVQLDIVWEDKPANHARIESMLDAADCPPGTLVILPELADTGFSFNLKSIVDDQTLTWAAELARTRGFWVQAGYAALGPDNRGRNCMTIIAPDGSIVGTYQKIHPFSYGARETEFFSGGDHLFLHQCDDPIVCPIICYDLRFPELFRLAALAGAEVFTLGASWPDARQTHWRSLLIARAIENQAYVIGVNRTGTDPHLSYAGGSIIISPQGDILAEAGSEQTVLQADLDLDVLRAWRADFPALRDIKPHLLGSLDIERS